ncbi:MAG: helix-turn-helix domain-containing protein [Muribaculaceae bacterium]
MELDGWALLFHPDMLHGTPLEKNIRNYSFFDYNANEALNTTEDEYARLADIMKKIKDELDDGNDDMQDVILKDYISLQLNYCKRFYDRQFFGDMVKKHTGDSAKGYIHQFVIQKAKNLLASGETISSVAQALGFEYPQHLSRLFKKKEGISPSAYLDKIKCHR